MSHHKIQKPSFGNYGIPKKSSPLTQTRPWTNPYQKRDTQASQQPENTVKPPTTEEWMKNNVLLKAIQTRQAELQQQSIQAKLTNDKPADQSKVEADMMNSQVLSTPDTVVQKDMVLDHKVQAYPLREALDWTVEKTQDATKWIIESGNSILGKKWGCENVGCNVQQIDRDAQCPGRVYGNSDYVYSNFEDACEAAKRDANFKVPKGCYKRHCDCNNKCKQK